MCAAPRNIDPSLDVSSEESSETSIDPFAMNSFLHIYTVPHFFQIIIIFYIMVCNEISLAQNSPSMIDTLQGSSRTGMRSDPFHDEQPPAPWFFLPFSDPLHSNFTGSASVRKIMEKYPYLRDAVMKEYLRLSLNKKTDINVTQRLQLYFLEEPYFIDEFRRNILLYGVPYNPLRPQLVKPQQFILFGK
jgi:hypothetical protein